MSDELVILADFSQDPKPEKKPEAPKVEVKEVKIEQPFVPRPPRNWEVNQQQADFYIFDLIKHGDRPRTSIEVMFAGKYIGLVHLIPQTKEEASIIVQMDAAHGMAQTVVFSGRWAEPQVNAVLRAAERAEKSMPQKIQDEFDEAALNSLTRIQAKDRIQAVIDTVTALLDPETHKISVGELTGRADARGVMRMYAPVTVVFPSGTVFRAHCDAIHGLREVEISYADPVKLTPEELLKLAQ